MKIYTSYFAKAAILRKAGIVPIGVALWPPRFFRGISMKQVAPRRYMLDDRLTDEEYIRMYRNDVLRLVDARSFIQDLERASRGMDVALCCFEKPGDFCHRHILAKWLNEQTGIEVSEFGVAESKQETPKPEQQSLF
jgi:hypothetical protein|nr:MAG TPA: protein of unknown function DUF488 [Caudoviricetes sp.]